MAAHDNLHSRVVSWLKVILPLCALGLLSSVFLIATHGDNDGEIPFSERELEEMASEQTVEDPVFSSVTDDGKRIVLTADEATPRAGDYNVVDAVQVHGTVVERDGETIDLRSDLGTLYASESRTVLQGNVRIVTSSGYQLFTDELISSIDRTDMETTGPVDGTGPLGTIEAGRMLVTSKVVPEGAKEKVTVVFKDGVKVIYEPQPK